jgi:hypothetical protein
MCGFILIENLQSGFSVRVAASAKVSIFPKISAWNRNEKNMAYGARTH